MQRKLVIYIDKKTCQCYNWGDKKTWHNGGIIMDKEKILAKSREENYDEGVEYRLEQAEKRAMSVLMVLVFSIAVINFFGKRSTSEILMVYFSYMAMYHYGRYKVLEDKKILKYAILCGVFAVQDFVEYAIAILSGVI